MDRPDSSYGRHRMGTGSVLCVCHGDCERHPYGNPYRKVNKNADLNAPTHTLTWILPPLLLIQLLPTEVTAVM